jgi:hypothetical protein
MIHSIFTSTQDVHMQPQLQDFQNEEIARVATKPSDFLKVSLEDEQNGGRGSALLLTKEDILSIKRYERYALNLPHTLQTVQIQLGIDSSGIRGLEPFDIMNTHVAIREHIISWASIERNIKLAGFQIDLFADTLTRQGREILKYIDGMDFLEQALTTVAEVTQDIIDKMVPAQLSDRDMAVKSALSAYIADMGTNIRLHQQSAVDLKNSLITFTTALRNALIPDVMQKLDLVKQNNLEHQIQELRKDIERLTKDIDQKNKEYSTAKKNIAWGVLGGPIGVAITGGIFGSKAEQFRKEKNKLVAEKNEKIAQLNIKQPISAAVRSLEVRFQDMHIRMEDAVESATNLQDLWALMANYIESSAKDLEKITDNQVLLQFALNFRSVINPWADIKGVTERLLKIFEDALEQFKLEQN